MTTTDAAASSSPLLDAVLNLSRFHREHEKFYATSPRELAVTLQRHARTLHALAEPLDDHGSLDRAGAQHLRGTEDLNDPAALQLEGVLFMEGEATPAELARLLRDLRSTADDFVATGEWLANAMQASWDVAAALIDIEGLGDMLGERHRIIANDWLAADMQALVARLLRRAADILDHVDFTPKALRADLAGARRASGLLHSAAELINRAADLCSDSAGIVNDHERRWRVFRQRVSEIVQGAAEANGPPHGGGSP